MTVIVAQAAGFIGVSPNEELLPALLSTAISMVDGYLGITGLRRCPDAQVDHAVLQLTSELWARRNAPAGGAHWGPDGQTAYLSRDPMASVYPLLRQYKGLGAVA